jgi:predicted AAA+ superfamily ATPase
LSGRIFLYELFPLMLCELAASPAPDPVPVPLLDRLLEETDLDRLLSDVPPRLPPEQEDRLRSFEQYLLTWGGMPGLLGLSEADRLQWLRSYEFTYLERDLADLARLSDLDPFKKFQRLSALRSGQLLSYSELARDAGVSADTARRYLEYLRISYQSILLPPFSRNLTSQVIKTPKIYWTPVYGAS